MSSLLAHFIGSDQKFYLYPGGSELVPFGYVIEEAFFNNLQASQKDNIVFGYDEGLHKLYVFYPSRIDDANDTYAQAYYAFNKDDNPPTWEAGRFADTVRGLAMLNNQVVYTCDGSYYSGVLCDEGSVKSLSRCDLAYNRDGYPTACFINDGGNAYKLDKSSGQHNETDIECIIETGDFVVRKGEQKTEFRAHEISFNATCKDSPDGTGMVNVYYSTDYGDTFTEFTDSPVTLTTSWAEYRLEFDVKDTQVRLKYVQNSNKDFQLRGQTISVKKETERE